jgi:hypothetical protein
LSWFKRGELGPQVLERKRRSFLDREFAPPRELINDQHALVCNDSLVGAHEFGKKRIELIEGWSGDNPQRRVGVLRFLIRLYRGA